MAFKDWLKEYRESQDSQSKDSKATSATSSKDNKQSTSGSSGSGGSGFSFRDSLQKYRESQATISLDGWGNNSSALLKEIQERSKNWYDDETYQSQFDRISKLLSQADNWRKQYEGNSAAVSYIDSVVNALSEAKSYAFSARQHYSQWDTEDAYNNWQTFNKDHSTVESRQDWYSNQLGRLNKLKADRNTENSQWAKVDPIVLGAESVEYQTAAYEHTQKLKAIDDEIAAIEAEINNYKRGNYNEAGQYYGSKTVDDYYSISQREDFDAVSANRDFGNATKEDFDKWYYQTYGGVMIDPETGKEIEGSRVNPGVAETSKESLAINDPLGFYLQAKEQRDSGDARYNSFGVASREYDQLMTNASTGSWDELEDTEIGIYYVLLNEQGYDSAMKYLSDMEVELNKRATMNANKNTAAAYDDASLLGKVMLNAASVAAGTLSAPWVMMENVVAAAKGEEINPYSTTKAGMHFSTTVRDETAKDFNADGGNIPILTDLTGFTKGDAYQAGMSILDSYAAIGIGGKLGGVLLATSAANSEANRLYEQGASMKQIALGSAAAGAAEMVFESLSIDKLITMKDAKNVWQAVANALTQAGIEASEEGFTEIANIITNSIIMGGQSDWAKLVEKYGGGVEGTQQAFLEKVRDVVNASIGGFISGAGSAGGPSLASGVANQVGQQMQYANTGKAINYADGGVDALLSLANEVAGVSEGKTQKALNRGIASVGKNAGNIKVGKLYDTVKSANNQANAPQNKADIVKSLTRKGLKSETATDIADALIASYNGKALTKYQTKLLESVENNSAVKAAISNIVANPNSTMGQRTQNIRDFEHDIDKGVVYKHFGLDTKAAKQAVEKQFTPEGTYETSVEGKALRKDTNEDIDIKGIASIKNGEMLLDIGDGNTINAKDVIYASEEQALIYEAVANLGDKVNATTATKLIKQYKGGNAMVFARGMAQAYTYGFYGLDTSELMGKNSLATELTQEQRNYAYNLGNQYRNVKDHADKANAHATKAAGAKGVYFRSKDGTVTDFRSYEKDSNIVLKDVQKTAIDVMERMSKIMGVRFNVFESWEENGKRYYLDENGVKTEGAPNGFYDPRTGEIYIDLAAGNDFQGTMLFTVAHELTHFMRQWSPEHFTKIARIVFKHGVMKDNVSALVAAKQAKAKANGKPISYDTAMEEAVADGMETILKDGKVVEFMADVKQADHAAWEKIKDWFKNLAKLLKDMISAYSSHSAQTTEGARVAAFAEDLLHQIEQIYAEGAVAAGENYQAAEVQENTTEDGGVKMMVRENTDIPYKQYRKLLNKKPLKDSSKYYHKVKDARIDQYRSLSEEEIPDIDFLEIAEYKKVDEGYVYTIRNYDKFNFAILGRKAIKTKYDGYVMEVAANGDTGETTGNGNDGKGSQLQGHETGNRLPGDQGAIQGDAGGGQEAENTDQERSISHSGSDNGRGGINTPTATEAMDVEVDDDTESVAPTVLKSERTWTESDYVQERETAAQEIAKAIGVSVKKAKDYIDSVNSIAKMIAEDRVRLDYFSSPGRSSFVGNVEYGGSFDFSTLCKKRRLLTGTFTAIQKALPNTALTADEILDIRNRMKEKGLEVSCGLCYVEGSRANMGQFAKEFLRLYKQYYPDAWQPNMADVNTPDGIEWVRINHPECYEQYEYFWNHYGTLKEGDKNLFASQQKPKLYQLHTEYKGEILEKFNDDDNVEEKNLNGGIRLQSFSDFEIVHLIDTMQIIMDMSRVGLAGQAYTKVPDFAWALGDTGLKINLSLIAKGVDENGRLIFDDVEGMPIDKAVELRNRYSKNVGTILVAFNDEQLLAAMADERVDYIIPFHRSQWKKSQYGAMGLPTKTKDYTYMQNEKFIKPQFHEYRGRMVQDKATNYMPNEYWDFSKSGKENAEAYLEMCARNNKRPKFYKLLQNNGDGSYSLKADGSTDGYWKLLIDFKMYDNDGNGSPQMPVKPDFNMDEATRMLNEYSGGHSNFPVAQGIVDDFVQEYKDSHKGALFSDRDAAPTFYSHMARVVNGVKQDKLGAASVVSMLRGKGVKAEEIKWSGIEDWLEGKKSVTKADLQAFIAGSMLQIEEEILDNKERPYTDDQQKRLDEYEAKRAEVVKRLADEWKKITGDEFPVRNPGYDLESTVVNKIIDANDEYKDAAFEGRLLKKLRNDLKEVIENNDDFGFDSWKDALRAIHRYRKDFIKNYEMSTNDKAIIVKYCNALNAYNELPNKISDEDSDRLRAIARETEPLDRKIREVKHEYNEDAAKRMTKWDEYKLDGGKNYRETLFRIPDSSYSNSAMYGHWGGRRGVLAHARIQDMDTTNGKMLFIDEIQSDWHNQGHKEGYRKTDEKTDFMLRKESDAAYKEFYTAVEKMLEDNANWEDDNAVYYAHPVVVAEMFEGNESHFEQYGFTDEQKEAIRSMVAEESARQEALKTAPKHDTAPDAPFKDTYHEYVLKRLLRIAAEEGYDSIGWTTAATQMDRWNPDRKTNAQMGITDAKNPDGVAFEKAYLNLYDRRAKKFLENFGDKWGTTVGKTVLDNGTEVWSMAITDEMKDSVMTEGQPLYQDRDTESVSNRSLLANALEGAAKNDIERNKIQEYKSNIDLINAEERKLRELNEKIKELSFAKGPKDTKAIRSLQFEARQTANRINTYDKQLLRLEASQPLQDVLTREKKMAYQRAEKKGKEALEAYREKTMKTQRELLEKWQESRKKGIDSRNRTAMRHKIKDIVNELNQYLLHGTKDRHVPIELQKAVAEALDAVNMDTVGAEERIAKLQDELLKAKTPEKIQEIARKIDHIQQMGDKMNGRLQKLKDAYDQFDNSDDPMIANSHDEVISNKLQSVIDSIGNTPLRDMTLAQLEDVYDMYRMVLTTIRNANKAFKAKKSESISTIANRVMEEVENVGGKKKLTMKGMDGIKSFVWNNLKPVYAFEHIGSDTFTDVFNAVRSGEDVWAVDVTEAREFYLDKSKKHGYNSWDFKKRFNFKSTSGMDFSLDLEQIMSLYAYSKRDQAADHLKKGGIVIDETTEITIKNKLGIPVKFNPTEATAYNISEPTLAEIISKLTDEQKAFVDEMQDYLSTVMGAKGNEVSLEMYGIKLFKEKFYFPLKSAHQFMAKAKEQQKGEVKIKNSGFSKETVQKASNPIVLTPFMNVWSDHVNEMSMYHAFVLPMEDFYRVYHYKTPTSETMATESVEMFIQNAYGMGATKYIDQLLKDLDGGARTDSTTGFINKMMGLFKKGSVFASLSVVVQQPSAVARAAALVDAKYFIGHKVDHKRHKALWDEVKQYAPVAIIKEMGYFDTNMGKSTQDFILAKEHSGFKEKMAALFTDSGYRDEALSKAPALADEIAWCSIWEAVKRETNAKYPGMDVKSEAFLKMAGERFTEVIVKTQVYDSVLSRSGMMRSKDTGMKMATAFMAEPTTSINMIADALLQGKRGNKKYARAAIGAVIASQILNSILVSFVYAGRDDDEDETYVEKYIGTLTGEILDSLNPAGYIPFIKDIMSITQGYDVERSDMAVVSDLWKAWENLSNDKVSVYRKVEGFAGSIAQLFGLPVKNIMRDARGIYQTIMSFVNGQQTTAAGIGYAVKGAITGKTVSDQQQLYEAYLSGDKAQIARVKGRFKDQSAINTAIRKALRENDPRIQAAAVARYNGNIAEYTRIAKEIIAEKHFSQDDVVAAINAEINAMDKGETTSSAPKASGLYKAEDFAVAISNGDQAMANAVKTDIIRTAQKNGKSETEATKSFNSAATTACKDLFLEGKISDEQAVDALATYCGRTEDEALADVQYWAFKQDYPDIYADDAWFDKYYEDVADSGIEIDVYMEYRNQVKDIDGEGKKERRMAVIHSLPITSAQKDALYYAEGWAASKLNEAPWH